MDIEILFENEHCLVINKPAGVSVHSDGKDPSPTIADWMATTYPESREVGEPMLINGVSIHRAGIVHRLDKETSGCLLLAKTQEAYEYFKSQFQAHTIEKEYHMFVYGAPKEDKGVIREAIGRSGGDIRKWTTGKNARGTLREAVTEYEVRARVDMRGEVSELFTGGSTAEGVYAFVVARPKTGRTHQIRVHMRYLNTPIVSDPLYRGSHEFALGFNRLALHAFGLTFRLLDGQMCEIDAPYPADFQEAFKSCGI